MKQLPLTPMEFAIKFKDVGPETLFSIYEHSTSNTIWWPSCHPDVKSAPLPELVIPLKTKESS